MLVPSVMIIYYFLTKNGAIFLGARRNVHSRGPAVVGYAEAISARERAINIVKVGTTILMNQSAINSRLCDSILTRHRQELQDLLTIWLQPKIGRHLTMTRSRRIPDQQVPIDRSYVLEHIVSKSFFFSYELSRSLPNSS